MRRGFIGSFLRYLRVAAMPLQPAYAVSDSLLYPSIIAHYEFSGIKERFRRFIIFSVDRLSRMDYFVKTLLAMKSPQAKRESLLSKQFFHAFQSRKGLIWLPQENSRLQM